MHIHVPMFHRNFEQDWIFYEFLKFLLKLAETLGYEIYLFSKCLIFLIFNYYIVLG